MDYILYGCLIRNVTSLSHLQKHNYSSAHSSNLNIKNVMLQPPNKDANSGRQNNDEPDEATVQYTNRGH